MIREMDAEKPEITENQLLCDGCWSIVDKTDRFKMAGWVSLNFKTLKKVDLCPDCVLKDQGQQCFKLQAQGL